MTERTAEIASMAGDGFWGCCSENRTSEPHLPTCKFATPRAETEAILTPEQEVGVSRLTQMLPALASYYDPRDSEARNTCVVCQDCECGGACQGAMEVVHQIIEALGCGPDDWDWWRESFADDGVLVPETEDGVFGHDPRYRPAPVAGHDHAPKHSCDAECPVYRPGQKGSS